MCRPLTPGRGQAPERRSTRRAKSAKSAFGSGRDTPLAMARRVGSTSPYLHTVVGITTFSLVDEGFWLALVYLGKWRS
jgi:hypothetical protein